MACAGSSSSRSIKAGISARQLAQSIAEGGTEVSIAVQANSNSAA
jgi:hypothetical protein